MPYYVRVMGPAPVELKHEEHSGVGLGTVQCRVTRRDPMGMPRHLAIGEHDAELGARYRYPIAT